MGGKSVRGRESIVQGLRDRTRNLLRAFDRQDRLETASEFAGWLGRQDEGSLASATREIMLRALRVVGDPVNFRIIEALDPLDATSVPDLMQALGLGRVALSERINDLVQVGLASRELIDDQIRSTPFATGMVLMVGSLARESALELQDDLAGGEEGKS